MGSNAGFTREDLTPWRCSIVIPTVPNRRQMRRRAIASAQAQTKPCEVIVVKDEQFTGRYRRGGAAATRNAGLAKVRTDWVAFLDDDDELYPDHVELCLAKADETGADLVYPWFDGVNAEGVLYAPWDGVMAAPEGREFGGEQIEYLRELGNFIPVTVVARTEAVRRAGGFPTDRDCEDWHLWNEMLANGAKFVHLPKRTWHYWGHNQHLSYAWA